MIFKLKAEFVLDELGQETEKSEYTIEYNVRLLKEDDSKGVFYNRDLGIHVENKLGIEYFYEIETKDVNLSFPKRIRKSEDFMRRLFYRYDWIQFGMNAKGTILSMLNKEEIIDTWGKLMHRIKKDYKGIIANSYLSRLNNSFKNNGEPGRSVNHYLHFGLLFPRIPIEHNREWTNKRMLRASEYEEVRLEETLTYIGMEDKVRTYEISGSIAPEYVSKVTLLKYEGLVRTFINELFPTDTNLEIEYTMGDTRVAWKFDLKRTDQ